MISSSGDFMFPEKNIFSEAEENFKAILKSNMNMDVIQTLRCYAAYGQMCIFIWCDTETYRDFFARKKDTQNKITEDVIDTYLECFAIKDIKRGCSVLHTESGELLTIKNIVLYIRDFRADLISYAYGNALIGIRRATEKLHNNVKVYLDYARIEYLIECDESVLNKVRDGEDKIKDIIYSALKEYDKYGVIAPSDIRVRISVFSAQNNDIHMTNRSI